MTNSSSGQELRLSLNGKTFRALKTKKAVNFLRHDHSYERLKVLYKVSKMLACAPSVGKVFPDILKLCVSSFPLVTGILIERRENKMAVTAWHEDNISKKLVTEATDHAKKTFNYLLGASVNDGTDPLDTQTTMSLFTQTPEPATGNEASQNRSIIIPLVVDRLPAFGILQLDGSVVLKERDLEFVDSLANLIAVAIDRNYKTELERALSKKEAIENLVKLSSSQSHVLELEDERELREKFVSMLTHDLRTPLSAAKISGQLIQRQPDLSEGSRLLAGRIVCNVKRADQMITDLLDANRVRSGEKLILNLETIELVSLVKETLEELSTVHGERFFLAGDISVYGVWDRGYIRRVVENLANNAIKYGDPHESVTVTIWSDDDKAMIKVFNKGEPITASEQKTLFQQFKRSAKASKSRKKGWGIGLTLVRGVVEAHGGVVKLESSISKGTQFIISIPLDSSSFIVSSEEL